MKVWAVGVVMFFGLAELYQWFQGLSLPLPVYATAGLILALASNADRWSGPLRLPLSGRIDLPEVDLPELSDLSGQSNPQMQPPAQPGGPVAPKQSTSLPLNPPPSSPSSPPRSSRAYSEPGSISFTIRRPEP